MLYFSDYTHKQWPDKDYLFSILGALQGDQLKELIQESRKKRSGYEKPDINEYTLISILKIYIFD